MSEAEDKKENAVSVEPMGESRKKSRRKKVQEAKKSLELQESEKRVGAIELTQKEVAQIKEIAESEQDEAELTQQAIEAKAAKEALKQAKKLVNPSVPSKHLLQRPGWGVTKGTALLHARDSFRFILGREASINIENGKRIRKPKVYGLLESTKYLNDVEAGYKKDCPYAAKILIEIEQQIKELRDIIQTTKTEAEALIKHSSAIALDPFVSKNPTEIELNFKSIYAFHYTNLITQFDEIVRTVLSYKIQHFITHNQYSKIESTISKPLRRLLCHAPKWKYVGREAVNNKTAQLQEAEFKMGILSEDVKNGKIAPEFIQKN